MTLTSRNYTTSVGRLGGGGVLHVQVRRASRFQRTKCSFLVPGHLSLSSMLAFPASLRNSVQITAAISIRRSSRDRGAWETKTLMFWR